MVETSMLDAALGYLSRGWSVIPLQGKIPRVHWADYKTRKPTEQEVRAWWSQWPEAGVGAALGRVSGIVRVDADGGGASVELERLGGLPPTMEFATPSGGRGWLLQYVEGVATEILWKGDEGHSELRVQSDRAYTVLPPSLHPAGGRYAWVNSLPPAKVPQWLYDRAVERVLQDLVKELRPTLRQPDRDEVVAALEHVDPDEYDTWVKVGMALKSADMFDVWEEWSRKSGKFKDGECARKWASFSSAPGGLTLRSVVYWAEQNGYKPSTRHEPITDLGNARVLARIAEGKALHSSEWGWLAWDGKRWIRGGDAEKRVVELQKAVLEYRLNRAAESYVKHLKSDTSAPDFEAKKKQKGKTFVLIRKHEEECRIRGARVLAESEPALSADYRLMDKRPYLFNCVNGTLDLETGELRAHSSTDFLTQICDVAYDPAAQCPRWEQFVAEILPDPSVREFLQQFLGCCLTGDTSVQIMPVFWGGGANGKSTLIGTLMLVLGADYSMKAKRDLLMLKRGSEHPTSIARLHGKRLVTCIETQEEGRLDETLVKELTGGDVIAARRMREDEWEFTPTHKPILVTNHKPEIRGTDDAIWRRLPLVPFTQQFPVGDPRRDGGLPLKLAKELPGILRWMVDGCRAWFANNKNLPQPETVVRASQAYRREQDRLGTFIEDRCVVGEGKRVRVERLVEAYAAWCVVNRHQQLNGNAFGRALSERGFQTDGKYRVGLDVV